MGYRKFFREDARMLGAAEWIDFVARSLLPFGYFCFNKKERCSGTDRETVLLMKFVNRLRVLGAIMDG